MGRCGLLDWLGGGNRLRSNRSRLLDWLRFGRNDELRFLWDGCRFDGCRCRDWCWRLDRRTTKEIELLDLQPRYQTFGDGSPRVQVIIQIQTAELHIETGR